MKTKRLRSRVTNTSLTLVAFIFLLETVTALNNATMRSTRSLLLHQRERETKAFDNNNNIFAHQKEESNSNVTLASLKNKYKEKQKQKTSNLNEHKVVSQNIESDNKNNHDNNLFTKLNDLNLQNLPSIWKDSSSDTANQEEQGKTLCNIQNYVGQTFIANDISNQHRFKIENLGTLGSTITQTSLHGDSEWNIGTFSAFTGDNKKAKYTNGEYCGYPLYSGRKATFEIVETNDPSEHEEMVAFEPETCIYEIEMKCYIPTPQTVTNSQIWTSKTNPTNTQNSNPTPNLATTVITNNNNNESLNQLQYTMYIDEKIENEEIGNETAHHHSSLAPTPSLGILGVNSLVTRTNKVGSSYSGSPFDDIHEPWVYGKIVQIELYSYSNVIRFIGIKYASGQSFNYGSKLSYYSKHLINLDENQHIVKVSGQTSAAFIRQLALETNDGITHGPFGASGGYSPFSFDFGDEVLLYIFGRADSSYALHALGFAHISLSTTPGPTISLQPSSKPSSQPTGYPTISPKPSFSFRPSVIPSDLPSISPSSKPSILPSAIPSLSIQPSISPSVSFQPSDPTYIIRTAMVGGTDGGAFDHRHYPFEYGKIVQIEIYWYSHSSYVRHIGIKYENGQQFGQGYKDGNRHEIINLNADQYIVAVSGRYNNYIHQITFQTSDGITYGPYGDSAGWPFNFDFGGNVLMYIFGRSGWWMDKIGFAHRPLDPSASDDPIVFVDFSQGDDCPNCTSYSLENGAQILTSPIGPQAGGTQALRIDSDGPYAKISDIDIGPTNMPHCSLTIGVYLESVTEGNLAWIFGHEEETYDRGIILYDARFSNNNAQSVIGSGTGQNWTPWANDETGTPPTKEWFHVTAVFRQGGECAVYVNGVKSDYTTIGQNDEGKPDLYVGRPLPWDNRWADAWIKEVKVFDRALFNAQIKSESDSFLGMYEAEDPSNVLSQSSMESYYADMGGQGSWIEWPDIDGSSGGPCTLKFRYAVANPSTTHTRPCQIQVDNVDVGTITFPPTGETWSQYGSDSVEIMCPEGSFKVRMTATTSNGGPNVDYLQVLQSLPSPEPSWIPSSLPSISPSSQHTFVPSLRHSSLPSISPSSQHTFVPSLRHSSLPSSENSHEPTIAPSLLSSAFPSAQPTPAPNIPKPSSDSTTTHKVDRDVTIEIETSSEEEEQVADTVENTLTQIIQDFLQQNEDNYEDEHVNGAPAIQVINTVCNGIFCYVDSQISSEIKCPGGICNDISIQSVEATFSSWIETTINQVIDGSYVTIFTDYALSNGYDSLADVGSIQFTLDFFSFQDEGEEIINVPTASPTSAQQNERPSLPPYFVQYLVLIAVMLIAVVIALSVVGGIVGLGILFLLRSIFPSGTVPSV